MKALISTIEPVQTGYRVAQVEQDVNIFDVADSLFWIDCEPDVLPDQFWYDPADETIKPVPVPELPSQPTVDGAETL